MYLQHMLKLVALFNYKCLSSFYQDSGYFVEHLYTYASLKYISLRLSVNVD